MRSPFFGVMEPSRRRWDRLAHACSAAQKVSEFIVTPAISPRRCGALETEHGSASALDAAVVLFKSVVIGHNFYGGTGGWANQAAGCILGVTGTGASGARQVGRPRYLMSCELALLSGRPCDQPGCAVSANP